MGILNAMNRAVGGLNAQSFALENIAGNIANSQTTAYKRVDTGFKDMVADAGGGLQGQSAGSVAALARPTNNVQGSVEAQGIGTYMGINGDGYFVVEKKTGEVSGAAVFAGGDLYTRRGDFTLDKDGYLVNGAGYYLTGRPVDPRSGAVTAGVADVIRIPNDFLAAQETTRLSYRTNLASYPRTANADAAVPGSELWDYSGLGYDPTPGGTGEVLGADEASFVSNSIAGGAVTVFDANGTPATLQLRWAKIDSADTGTADTWNLFYLENSSAGAAEAAWRAVPETYIFDAAGRLDPSIGTVSLGAISIDGVSITDVTLDHGLGSGVTQFDDPSGTAVVSTIGQDGIPGGERVGVAVTNGGRVVATYSNGRTIELAQVEVVTFNAPNGLRQLDGGAYAATDASGGPMVGGAGEIIAGGLEASNVDIGQEFSKLIVTQQAFTANSRIITTSDEMLQEVLNIVR